MKRNILSLLLILFIVIFSFVPNEVNAKEILKRGESSNIDKQVVGAITLYDDYTITFEYNVMFRNPVVKVCPVNSCSTILPQVNTQQVYLDKETLTFSLSEYISQFTGSDILVIASGEYKLNSSDLGYPGTIEIQYKIEYENSLSDDSDSKELNEHMAKINDVVNKWVIPGIYIVLAVIFVIKLILLSIDLAKFSDQPEIRKEKFKGFIYVFVGLLAVAVVNASAGFITGLYD